VQRSVGTERGTQPEFGLGTDRGPLGIGEDAAYAIGTGPTGAPYDVEAVEPVDVDVEDVPAVAFGA
jgi:hypothetical protein